MKSKLVSLWIVLLGVSLFAAPDAFADYYMVYPVPTDCDSCYQPQPAYSCHPRYHRHYRHHYYRTAYRRPRSSYHISVYYVWQVMPVPPMEEGCNQGCAPRPCGRYTGYNAPRPCAARRSCEVAYPDSTYTDRSETGDFDYDMRTRDDIYS